MSNRSLLGVMVAAGVAVLAAGTARAVTIDLVPVSNMGNTGELSGAGAGGYGANRICGAVDYVYQIGKYEVTAGQYTEFLNAVGGVDTYALYDSTMSRTDYGSGITRSGGGTSSNPYTYSVDAAHVNRPVNRVSWGDAARFSNWLANGQPTGAQGMGTTEDGSYYLDGATSQTALLAVTRKPGATWVIPSEDEWYKAAYHKNDGDTGNYFTYPTSSDSEPGRNLADPLPGNNANYYGSPRPIQSPYYTTQVGEFQNSDSPYGTFDQGGNVSEWNEANISNLWRGLRGGSYDHNPNSLAASYRGNDNPTDGSTFVGFRVANVPEPGSIALLVCGLVSLICLRRRK